MRRLLPALILALAVLPAQAQLYKWVDERGVVNYGDAPPAQARKVQPLDPARSTLSVVPGLSPEELARQQQRVEQARIDRLEREVADLRNRPAPPPVVVQPPAEPPAYPVIIAPRPPKPRPLPQPHPVKPKEPEPPPPTSIVVKPR